MSQLDDLLARSRSPGKFVERRRFTLSREKAIEKQREFALRHPKQYILEIVQAAVFAGATYIAIDTRPNSALVAWVGGTRLLDKDLANLLDYLFADRGDPRCRHLVQLAVGVNAILQRKPRTLRIETGDGERSVRMDLDQHGRGHLGVVEDAIGGTYLFAEFGGGWFSRFTGSSYTEEQGLVELRCLYTPVPILLNGGAPFGYRGSRHIEIFGAKKQVHFDGDGRRGVVAVHASERALTGFRIVVGGVWVTTQPLDPLATRPLVGVICDDGLRKTADHSDIVQDHRYVEMLHAVQPHATQLMEALDGPRYRPPALPPVARPEKRADSGPPEIEAEALPATLRMVPPRLSTSLEALEGAIGERGAETPLFYCTPEHLPDIVDAADPVRFPYRVLILSPGHAVTLERELAEVPLHRLQSKADVDFVRRVLERQERVREHRFAHAGGQIRMRLHLEGRLPDWGDGPHGVPFAVVRDGATVLTGVIAGDRVRPAAAGAAAVEIEPWCLTTPLHLPRTSVVIEADTRPDDALAARLVEEGWRLAVPDGGEPHRELLCALLGEVVLPQLQGHPLSVAANLPPKYPDALRHVPLVQTREGPLSLQGYLELLGGSLVVEVATAAELAAMDDLEARFGYGHLTHPELEDRPLYGVGRVNGRWLWLDRPDLWSLPALTQMIWVGATFSPRLGDGRWQLEAHPHPELVAVRRAEAEGEDWDLGWELLYRRLYQVDADDAWSEVPLPVGPRRARGMGRLALLHLAVRLGRDDQPLLLPSDGGARRSLRDVSTDPSARFVARHGVEVAEPWTFVVTRDELAVLAGASEPRLRYDDAPDVWRTLTDGPDTGWLLRQEVRQGGLEGWLGLRHPYDGTTGILVRTTGRLVAIPEMDRRIPCHGLLWPEGGAGQVTPEQVRLLQLAGLRLYQEVCNLLRTGGLEPDRAESARLYGFAFAKLAWRRERLTGTALALARMIEVTDLEGEPWGTLERWLEAPPDRPPAPEALVLLDDPGPRREETALVTRSEPELSPIHARLADALARARLKVRVTWSPAGRTAPVRVSDERSTRDHVVIFLNQDHPLVAAAVGPGRAREIVLLEAARHVALWAGARGLPVDLLDLQQALLAQRLDQA